MVQEESLLQVRKEITKVHGFSWWGNRGKMWDMNNLFLAMTPDLSHPYWGRAVVIHHQETTGYFLEV